ncbi:MAG: helix-turn-helix domain-containing protein [Vulcanibacillus sp.]
MESARVIGNNILLLLNERNITKEAFADASGYSLSDVQKLCDARLFMTNEDVKDIAKYFNVTDEYLRTDLGLCAYKGEDFLHCMGRFKRPENKDKILDIFDMYCDLKEALYK